MKKLNKNYKSNSLTVETLMASCNCVCRCLACDCYDIATFAALQSAPQWENNHSATSVVGRY